MNRPASHARTGGPPGPWPDTTPPAPAPTSPASQPAPVNSPGCRCECRCLGEHYRGDGGCALGVALGMAWPGLLGVALRATPLTPTPRYP
jgi:hypothetical protein